MLRGRFADAGETSPAALRAAYDEVLAETVDEVGRETVAAETDLRAETLQELGDGTTPELTLTEAAAILATDPERPDGEALAAEARDILLMGMATAVLDVEVLASQINQELDPKEIQQKIEGRFPMSLDEYALLHSHIEGRE